MLAESALGYQNPSFDLVILCFLSLMFEVLNLLYMEPATLNPIHLLMLSTHLPYIIAILLFVFFQLFNQMLVFICVLRLLYMSISPKKF